MTCRRQARIANEILMHFRGQKKTGGDVSLSDPIDVDRDGSALTLIDLICVEDDMLDRVSADETRERLLRYIHESLTEREAEIIANRYGLAGKTPLTQREVAATRGISRSYVYKPAYYKWMESRVTIHFFISIIGQACPNSIGFARVWGIPRYCLPVEGQAFANRRASDATTDEKWTGRNFLKIIRKELRNMADVKWIKLTVDFFDDEKVLLISNMPDGYIIILVWVKLLCLAGKQNNSGVFTLSNGVPYTEKMLATIFRLDEATVSLALKAFEDFGMIRIVNGAITITNWGKHQNLDKIEAYNEYQRNYMREYRSKQKAIATGEVQSKAKSKPNSKTKIREAEKELKIEQDKDIELDKKIDTDSKNSLPLDHDSIIKSYHDICKSLPKVAKLTASRKMAIDIASRTLDGVSFEQLFTKSENSDFLKGRVKDWKSDFDWIVQPEHIVKILSGLYDNREPRATANYSDQSRYENLKMED